jgi:hypothetical protein
VIPSDHTVVATTPNPQSVGLPVGKKNQTLKEKGKNKIPSSPKLKTKTECHERSNDIPQSSTPWREKEQFDAYVSAF